MKYICIIILSLLCTVANLQAQTGKSEKLHPFAIEVDPIAYILSGYSIHGLYQYKKFRFDVGIYGLKQPQFYSDNKDFTTRTMGVGFKTNYFLNRSETWFIGAGLGWTKERIEQKISSRREKQNFIGLGVHTGLRFNLFKTRFYISPWVSLDYNFPLDKIQFESDEYKTKKISIFPTIHLGYKF